MAKLKKTIIDEAFGFPTFWSWYEQHEDEVYPFRWDKIERLYYTEMDNYYIELGRKGIYGER